MEYSPLSKTFFVLLAAVLLSFPVLSASNYSLTAFEDEGTLKYYNFQTEEVTNTGYTVNGADNIGDIADIDNDSDPEISFKDGNYNIDYYNIGSGEVNFTGGTTDGSDTGGGWTGDIGNDGDIDVVFRDSNQNLVYYDSGSDSIKDTGSQTYDVGGVTDIDGDGYLEVFQELTSNSLGYHDFKSSSQTSLGPTVGAYVGGTGDIGGDEDIDVAHMGDNSNIHIFDLGSNSDTDTGVSIGAIGGINDADLDGAPEIAFISSNELKFYNPDTSQITTTGVSADDSVGGIEILDNSSENPLCDVKTSLRCISENEHNLSSNISTPLILESRPTSRIFSDYPISINSNKSLLSGLWSGVFNITADQVTIKPGAEFRPENGRIILGEY